MDELDMLLEKEQEKINLFRKATNQDNIAIYKDQLEYIESKPLHRASYKLDRNQKIKESSLFFVGQKPWGFIGNDGECSPGRRVNEEEIESILNWLDEKYNEIMFRANKETQEKIKNETDSTKIEEIKKKIKKFCDIVAIITPFTMQANYLKKAGFNYDFKNQDLNDVKTKLFSFEKNEESITIGTVHSLQGAEKQIVLFSNVYGANDIGNTPFVDRQKSIINVGVSRAKQSFYIFGNQKFFESFDSKEESATGLLWKYINLYKDMNENNTNHTQYNLEDIEDIIIEQIEIICLKEDNQKIIETVNDSTKTTKEIIDKLKNLGANIIKKENEK